MAFTITSETSETQRWGNYFKYPDADDHTYGYISTRYGGFPGGNPVLDGPQLTALSFAIKRTPPEGMTALPEGEPEYWQQDEFSTAWFDGTGLLPTIYARCSDNFYNWDPSGSATLNLYVHLTGTPRTNPAASPLVPVQGLPDGTFVHAFTTAGETFTYNPPAGTGAVAFTAVISGTRNSWPSPGTAPNPSGTDAGASGYISLVFATTDPPRPNPNPTPPARPPYVPPVYVQPPDPYAPGALVEAVTDSGSGSLLDQVRAFSSAVKRAVRITGTASIAMVDPAAPLPTGWSNADAPHLYSTTTHGAAAELAALSSRLGQVSLSAGAQMITDDVRLVPSTWRIPDRLPVYGLPAAPVKRVTYTLSPAAFSASLDFHFRDAPIESQR